MQFRQTCASRSPAHCCWDAISGPAKAGHDVLKRTPPSRKLKPLSHADDRTVTAGCDLHARFENFAFSIDVFDSFDSDPPDPEAARNDAGVVTSIGWTY